MQRNKIRKLNIDVVISALSYSYLENPTKTSSRIIFSGKCSFQTETTNNPYFVPRRLTFLTCEVFLEVSK